MQFDFFSSTPYSPNTVLRMFLRLSYKSMHDKYLLMEDLCLNVLALLAGEI